MATLYDDAIRVLAQKIVQAEVSRFLIICSKELLGDAAKTKGLKKRKVLIEASRKVSKMAENINPRGPEPYSIKGMR